MSETKCDTGFILMRICSRGVVFLFSDFSANHKEARERKKHYSDVIMSAIASQITGIAIVCLTVCWGADQRKHHSSASQAFMRGIHRWPVDSPHKGPVTRKTFLFDDVIMGGLCWWKVPICINHTPRTSANIFFSSKYTLRHIISYAPDFFHIIHAGYISTIGYHPYNFTDSHFLQIWRFGWNFDQIMRIVKRVQI